MASKELISLTPLWPSFAYKPHQLTGIRWMLEREDAEQSGGLLCDEMGLGKTMEVLGLLKNSKKHMTLLLCPKAVISQWITAAVKSNFNVMLFANDGWTRQASLKPKSAWLYITNYEKVTNNVNMFKKRVWDRIVLDEAHRIRNSGSVCYKAINKLDRKTMWAVTATPIVNKVNDINNLFALVGYESSKMTNSAYRLKVLEEACLHRSMEEIRDAIPELPAAAVITKALLDFET